MTIAIGILVIIVIVLGFTTWNLLTKNEKLEDVTESQQDIINKLTTNVLKIDETITTLDSSGAFQNDDEIGTFFEQIKSMRDTLIDNLSKQDKTNV